MPLKTYETIGILNRYYYEKIGDRYHTIEFRNGTAQPKLRQGTFQTSDKVVQNWLETNSDFNKKFRLVSVVPTAAEKLAETQPDEVDDDLAKTELPPTGSLEDDLGTAEPEVDNEVDEAPVQELNLPPKPEYIVVEDVFNGQQARNYLIENFKDGLTFRQLQNNGQIIAEAKKRFIQFNNWEAFITA